MVGGAERCCRSMQPHEKGGGGRNHESDRADDGRQSPGHRGPPD